MFRIMPLRLYGGIPVSYRKAFKNSLTYLIFPLAAVWLELMLHIKIRAELIYSPIYIAFAISAGLLIGLVPSFLRGKAEKAVRIIFLFLMWLIFSAESVGYYILQAFYPVSSLGTAAENRLYDYMDIILITIRKNILYLLILFVPVLVGILLPAKSEEISVKADTQKDQKKQKSQKDQKKQKDKKEQKKQNSKDKKKNRKNQNTAEKRYGLMFRLLAAILIVMASLVFHYTGILLTRLDWGGGDMAPSRLYQLDEYLDIQVERLGLITMLRLDVLHTLDPSTVAAPDMSFIPEDDGLNGLDPVTDDQPEEDPVDRSPHISDADLQGLMSCGNSEVEWIASYMNSVKPTRKNEYTGMFEGYNVIFLCLEAFSGSAINEELTPTLYKLSNECFVFNNFYTPLYYGSTNAGECQNLLGLYPKQGSPMSLEESGRLGINCYFSLGPQLAKKGYHNIGFHNGWDMYGRETTMANLGYYDWYYLGNGMEAETWSNGDYRWPQRDTFMIETTTDRYLYEEGPFNAYYMTISGHTPYSWGWIAEQYEEELAAYDWSESTKQYVATAMEVDRALAALLQRLEEAGQLEKTLIVAVADHIPYTAVESVGELMGKDLGTSEDAIYCNERYLDTEVYRNTLIMWTGSMQERVEVDKVCTQVDILPTLLNLLGVDYDSRMLPGSDMLSEAPGLVIFYSKCWRSDNGFYNSYTEEFTLNEGLSFSETAVEKYVESMNRVVDCKRYLTPMILATDFYDWAFG